jgi:hypothetical protein
MVAIEQTETQVMLRICVVVQFTVLMEAQMPSLTYSSCELSEGLRLRNVAPGVAHRRCGASYATLGAEFLETGLMNANADNPKP